MRRRPAIVDTNVVVAGLLTGDASAPTARTLDGVLRGEFPYVVSTALLAEIRTVLLRPRIRSRHRLDASEVDEILTMVAANAIVREPVNAGHTGPDPGDQHLLDLLAAVPEAVLVTGDAALIDSLLSGRSAMSPRAWIELLSG